MSWIIVDELNYHRMICIPVTITKYQMHCNFLLQVVFGLVKLVLFLPLSFCFLG